MFTREEDFILSYHGKLKNISYQGDFDFFLHEDLGQTYL